MQDLPPLDNLLFESSELPIVVLDNELSILKGSVSFLKSILDCEDIKGTTSFLNSVSDKDKKRVSNFLIRVLRSGDSGTVDYRIGCVESNDWVSFKWQKVNKDSQVFLLGIGEFIEPIDQDRLETLENEEALRDSEIIGKMGSWWVNPKTLENHWSEGNYRIWGVELSEEIPSVQWVLSKLHPEDSDLVLDAIKTVGKKGEPVELQFRMRLNEDEAYRIFMTRIRPWYVNGELIEVKGVNFEITDLINYQNDLEKQNLALSKSNETLSEFVRVNSHDVRGPLSNILSLLEWDQVETMNHKEFVDHVRMAANRLDDTLKKINTMLKIEEEN